MQNEFNRLCNDLQFSFTIFSFTSFYNLLKAHDSIQGNKFNKLPVECKIKQDAGKVIFNFSNVSLMEAEKSLLVKGLSLSLPPKKLSHSNYLGNFELFYRNIDNLKILSWYNLDYIETKIKDLALTSFCN